jgi:hypothetical protein
VVGLTCVGTSKPARESDAPAALSRSVVAEHRRAAHDGGETWSALSCTRTAAAGAQQRGGRTDLGPIGHDLVLQGLQADLTCFCVRTASNVAVVMVLVLGY